MPSYTPLMAIPYVDPDEALTDYPATMQELSERLEDLLGYVPIAEAIVAGAAVASIDFASIPAGYAHLALIAELRSDQANAATVWVRCNNDSGAASHSYASSVADPAGTTADTKLVIPGSILTQSDANADRFAGVEIDFFNYANAVHYKTIRLDWNSMQPDNASSDTRQGRLAAEWRSVAALNRITLLPSVGNFAIESRATLYAKKGF